MSAALYDAAVAEDNPASGYWLLEPESGDDVDQEGGADYELHNVTYGVPGPMVGTEAVGFNGVDAYGVTAAGETLAGLFPLTIEFWLKWDLFADNDDLVLELSSNANGKNGLRINPNSSDGSGKIATTLTQAPNVFWEDGITRPSQDAWHHYAFVFDRGAPAHRVLIDGILQEISTITHGSWSANTFDGALLYLMSRAGSALFGAGAVSRLALYPALLPDERIEAHYAAALEEEFTLVGRDLAGTYDMQSHTGADISAHYDLLASAGRDLTATYGHRATTGEDLAIHYDLWASASTDLIGRYSLRELAVQDLNTSYGIRNQANADLVAIYQLRSLAGNELAGTYSILAELFAVGADLGALYGVREAAGGDVSGTYHLRQLAAAEFLARYKRLIDAQLGVHLALSDEPAIALALVDRATTVLALADAATTTLEVEDAPE